MPPERPVVDGSEPVTLLGGGALGPGDLAEAMALAPRLVAADSGADAALAAGLRPDAVIGDLDSISPAARRTLPEDLLHEVAEQDSTDFDKALRHVAVPLTLAVGFTGARLDHQLAVLHTLVARPAHRCIVLGERDIMFNAPRRIRLQLEEGTRVSLFPLARVTGRSRGLRWPIDGLEFHPARRIGTSNEATGADVEIEADAPGLLTILPRAALAMAVAALLDPRTEGWSV
ncbi:thiamine diphosphokinase [Roseibacterium sp. SDUM158017]|nr:thiamine diphosphokinase [Roseibacterium sp. SDUM158017]MDG4648562.1 thiamine diphosphokinase [Roseibacterium sp. SDUM158017]